MVNRNLTNMKHFKFSLFIILASLLSGCPVDVNILLKNESDEPIYVVYSTGYQSKIMPSKTENEKYVGECVKIKYKEEVFRYLAKNPPSNFYDVSMFSSTLYATFTSDRELVLHPKNGVTAGTFKLSMGCSN